MPESSSPSLTVYAFHLCVPDDRTALGLAAIGQGVWFTKNWLDIEVRCMFPLHPDSGKLVEVRFAGRRPALWQLVGDWTGYAVTTGDGQLVYVPKDVWQYERRSNIFGEVDGI